MGDAGQAYEREGVSGGNAWRIILFEAQGLGQSGLVSFSGCWLLYLQGFGMDCRHSLLI
jgi:hypothetical protein